MEPVPARAPRIGAMSVAMLLATAVLVHAHEPGLSVLTVRVSGAGIEADLSLAPIDAERIVGRGRDLRTREDFEAAHERLRAFAVATVGISVDNRRLSSASIEVTSGDDAVHVRLVYPAIAAARMSITTRAASELGGGHRQLLRVLGTSGALIDERMVSARDDERPFAVRVSPGLSAVARAFIGLGVHHILSGYDHLLFLAGLVLTLQRLRDLAKTVTAFTVGHSITLASAAVGRVHVPSEVIEPLIAASIIYVAIENLRQPTRAARWIAALGFGLIHGFGFSGVLRDLVGDAHGLSVAAPLAAFNLGVEAGQLGAMAILWPALALLRTRPRTNRQLTRACSVVLALAGAYWLVTRL